jgi:serine/threonine protein kinase
MTPLIHQRESFFDLRSKDRVLVGDMPYIVEKQARGGMGCVYLLWQDSQNAPQRMSALGLKLALKAVLPDAADAEGIALFRRELTVWSAFRHTNIVWLLEIVDGGDAGWVAAMDWCIGSLRDLQKEKGKLTLKDSTNIVGAILDGLAYAYNQDKVLHLDLKPENVLYHLDFGRLMNATQNPDEKDSLSQYRFMVSDWGIASIKQPALNRIAGMPPSSEAVKKTFNNMGTLLYMAPERFKEGFSSSVASDVFSLGMIYLELLVGTLPFRADMHPVQSLVSGQYLKDAQSLMQRDGVTKPIMRLILRMIAYSPRDRFLDYVSLKKELIKSWRSSNGLFSKLFH